LAAAGAAELAAMRTVEIGGATGLLAAAVNGVYERTDEVKNGKPVFAKKVAGGSECDVGLWEAPDGYWYVTDRADIDANEAGGWACTVCAGVAHPAVPGTAWQVDPGGDDPLNFQEAVTVRTLTAVAAVSCSRPLRPSVRLWCSNFPAWHNACGLASPICIFNLANLQLPFLPCDAGLAFLMAPLHPRLCLISLPTPIQFEPTNTHAFFLQHDE
jgi:hypothetical protein